ncbi:MAG: hypothetical protein LLG05_14230 [Porphyromonadaceae bacterium]|nr:hypothetical protein [Porphyromonadaceae bacterium]
MKLINLDEDAPETFYIFVNQLNPMTEHNFKLTNTFSSGSFNSCLDPNFAEKYLRGKARYLPYEPCQADYISPSPFFLSVINDYRIEYDAEVYREKHHPLYPSRLSALFAFGDIETCKLVSQKHGWPLDTVYKFRLKEWPLTRIAKVNMEHISLARHAYKVSMLQEIDNLWGGYWAGFDEIILELPSTNFKRQQYNSGVIWEYLIEGIVECIK